MHYFFLYICTSRFGKICVHCTIKTFMTRKCLFEAKNKTNVCIHMRKWGEKILKEKRLQSQKKNLQNSNNGKNS